jgi:aldose 1-epimerase
MKLRLILAVFMLIAGSSGGFAVGNYSVTKKLVEGHTTYHLLDAKRKMDFGIVPDIGNFAYQFKVNGKDVLISPESFEAYLQKHGFGWGIPFLAPYANRIEQEYYYFQGRKFLLNDSLGNILRDQFKQPIHGLLVFDPRWEVVKTGGSETEGAFITSRMEFYKYPDLMAQFPFAQVYQITYRLKDGKLECTTKVSNVSKSLLPVLFAFHPYFHPDGPREDWVLSNSAKYYWMLTDRLVPTGEKKPTEELTPNPLEFKLGKTFLDNLFSDLERDRNGLGHVWVKGKTQKIAVEYSREYDFAVIYAPLDNALICLEPQTGPTNAFNLSHEGKFNGLIVLEPGKTFKATYRIIPTGF